MFLNNCWYVAAWDHELIDGALLAHFRRVLSGRIEAERQQAQPAAA